MRVPLLWNDGWLTWKPANPTNAIGQAPIGEAREFWLSAQPEIPGIGLAGIVEGDRAVGPGVHKLVHEGIV